MILCVSYIRNLLFLILFFSQGSVATHCRCGGKYDTRLMAKFTYESNGEKKLKIGQYLSKL